MDNGTIWNDAWMSSLNIWTISTLLISLEEDIKLRISSMLGPESPRSTGIYCRPETDKAVGWETVDSLLSGSFELLVGNLNFEMSTVTYS